MRKTESKNKQSKVQFDRVAHFEDQALVLVKITKEEMKEKGNDKKRREAVRRRAVGVMVMIMQGFISALNYWSCCLRCCLFLVSCFLLTEG